uniref:Uncharacterized protein n=1 Tax=Arundo donax TaxID=35708 RepID=A0A0A9GIL3_ARUDO
MTCADEQHSSYKQFLSQQNFHLGDHKPSISP